MSYGWAEFDEAANEEGSRIVRVEYGPHGLPIRIFRKDHQYLQCPEQWLGIMTKKEAVGSIRRQVFDRCEEKCEQCESYITWETMHMHEKVFKGKGGEVSLENSIGLCSKCHLTGANAAHADRKWQSAKLRN
jgi:hypothetical protein